MINQELVAAIAARSGVSPSEVVAAFRDSTRQDLANLHAAAAAPDRGLLALHAHGLRGASEMLGATDLAEACRRLESSASGGEATRLAEALADVEHQAQALDDCLRTLRAALDTAGP